MDKKITFEQGYEAQEYVRSYYAFKRLDPNNIDWDNKPENLPEDVSKAWDTYIAQQEQQDEWVDY